MVTPTPNMSGSTPSKKITYGYIEVLRIVAILGVIWFHIDGLAYRRLAYSGLIVFVIITVVLSGQSKKTTNLIDFAKTRGKRLLIPWLFWLSIYSIANLIKGQAAIPFSHDYFSTVLAGPWIGLWYLPFAYTVSLLAFCVYRAAKQISHQTIYTIALATGMLLLFLAEFARKNVDLFRPWSQWLHAAPAIPFGFAIASLIKCRPSPARIALICITPILYALITKLSDPGLTLTYTIAVPLTVIAFLHPIELPPHFNTMGVLCMGAYLTHGGLISVLKKLLPHTATPYMLFTLVSIGAFGLTYLVKKAPLIRHTV